MHWPTVCRRAISPVKQASMVEAAKCMFLILLGEANDDSDRAILQPHEDHRAHTTRSISRCFRTKTPSGSPCSPTEAATAKSCSRPETENEVLRSRSETNSPSHVPLEHVTDGDFREQLELSVLYFCTDLENGSTSSRCLLTTTMLNLLFAAAEQKGKTQNFRTHIGPGLDGSSANKLSLDLKFYPRNTDPGVQSRKARGSTMSRFVFDQYVVRLLSTRIFLHGGTLNRWRNLLTRRAQQYASTSHVFRQTRSKTSSRRSTRDTRTKHPTAKHLPQKRSKPKYLLTDTVPHDRTIT